MGTDRIRYLVFACGRYRWRPTKRMRAAGFRMINLSAGGGVGDKRYPSDEDKARAIQLNAKWGRHRRGLPAPSAASIACHPPGSVGAGCLRALALREAERKAKSIVCTNEQCSREDWPRAWKWIEPLFRDCDPTTVTPEQLLGLRQVVAAKVSESEAHCVIKVWRALWKKMAVFGYCDVARYPSLMFANSAPQPRQALWRGRRSSANYQAGVARGL